MYGTREILFASLTCTALLFVNAACCAARMWIYIGTRVTRRIDGTCTTTSCSAAEVPVLNGVDPIP